MKYYTIVLIASLAVSCNSKKGEVTFNGSAPGIKKGVFIVKTLGDSTVYGENISNGKFPENKYFLKEPGYYSMGISDEDNKAPHDPFEVYLEKGTYTVTTQPGKLYQYPKIESPSKIQQQLSAFYAISDKLVADINEQLKQLNYELRTKGDGMSQNDYHDLLGKISLAENKMLQSNVLAFKEFLKHYPKTDISTHLMQKLNYEDDPASYYAIYNSLSPTAKNSDEGKEIGDKLSHLIKLTVGVKAPDILGNTPDGKPFDKKSVNKKLILIDFWRVGNAFSRKNHEKLIPILKAIKNKNDFGILSVSLDHKPDWWTTAIKEDHMDWLQVSDLKGDDSPNAVNWSVSEIPTYYLVDSNWTIVARNLNIGNIHFELSGYLSKIH